MDRFIQADWRLDLFLQLRVIDDVFMMQRLFEHHHVVLVHLLEHVCIGQRVCRVCVTHQENFWKCRPDLPDHFDIQSRLDLDFDPAVTRL